MKKQFLSMVCTVSMLGSLSLPGLAQTATSPQAELPPRLETESSSVQPMMPPAQGRGPVTLPQSTGIIVIFPSEVVIDAGQPRDYPMTLPLAQAIVDGAGNVVVPENTPVSVMLRPTEGGAQVIAQSLVVNGQIVPIEASSPLIPGTTVTHMRANDRAVENGAVWGRLVGSGFGFMSGGDPDEFDRGAMLGSAVGLLSGLRSPENTRVVQIPQGSVFVLSLSAPVNLVAR